MKGKTYFDKHLFQSIKINAPANPDVGMIIVIPCFNEPDILSTLNSLLQCEAPVCKVEIIVVINASENAPGEVLEQNQNTFHQVKSFIVENERKDYRLFVMLEEGLPEKIAGVGLSRKIGMDEAAFRFESAGLKEGIIVCLDADCTVASNYLVTIESHYNNYPETKATSVYFEHPLDNDEDINEGIINYELHLRYYIQALRFCNYPFAYQTVGSSMAVRSDIYQQQGGMNKRKAGEDFYFLHKIMPLGGFFEINSTTVYPLPRISDRVPFGTGRAMEVWQLNTSKIFKTYSPQIFDDLREFFKKMDGLFQNNSTEDMQSFMGPLPETISKYLVLKNFYEKIREINQNSRSLSTYRDRFYRWFNGLMVLKFVHYSRDNYFDNIQVEVAAGQLLKKLGMSYDYTNKKDLLAVYRGLDKKGWNYRPTS